jgi:hypothetical protein
MKKIEKMKRGYKKIKEKNNKKKKKENIKPHEK